MSSNWTVLKHYDGAHLTHIALPVGGIGTGTVALGGRGSLRDWEIMNRPAKNFTPQATGRGCFPSIVLSVADPDNQRITRLMEGPLEDWEYEGHSGCAVPNHGLPRFRDCSFDASYPFGRVNLSDPEVPVKASIEAFNPLIPGDADRSSLPVAILRVNLDNESDADLDASVCVNLPNWIGLKGGERRNVNRYRQDGPIRGLDMRPGGGGDVGDEAWGSMALTTLATEGVACRTAWKKAGWGTTLLDFWDEFDGTGKVTDREADGVPEPMASLVVRQSVKARDRVSITYLLTWHFPNRRTWTPAKNGSACRRDDACSSDPDIIGNYYCSQFDDAWAVAEHVAGELDSLERATAEFVNTFLACDLPDVVKEGALFNLSTLRTQTVFRTPDGRLYGWEGCCDGDGCCYGSCTHVWNYETTTPFLFGDLARSMREVEFMQATDDNGLMSFRVNLPIGRAQKFGKAAADGQMGCIMKIYREWQLCGDTDQLRRMWPKVKAALGFCWIEGGWDADRDGVMEGCQHNTMDVEYYGPNPQMQGWYLGALRAAEEMALHLGDTSFAATSRQLFDKGKAWMDENLFNGEYYIHKVQFDPDAPVADGLRMNVPDAAGQPENQLAEGCLVDQLVGQYMAHVAGLGYLHDPDKVKTTLRSILRYNRRPGLEGHFNCMRSYALGDETALLMAGYPDRRPENPFPYFTEVMTGFEWTAAVGMLYEGMVEEGLACIEAIRQRYDGRRRNPYNEAECGHHYARAMAAWSGVLALTGFRYSAVNRSLHFARPERPVKWFWSSGYAWGTCAIDPQGHVEFGVLCGDIAVNSITVPELGTADMPGHIAAGDTVRVNLAGKD